MKSALSAIGGAVLGASCLLTISCATTGPGGDYALASNVDARVIDRKSRAALDRLYRTNPTALRLAERAYGVLVFPEIIKGGFVVGGAGGDGALYQRGQPAGFYRSVSASYGLQAGLQKHGYALILMDPGAVAALNQSDGWELGSAPSLTVVDSGVASSLSTTTINEGTYAFFFDQKGLMGGIGVEGTKITRLAIQP